MNGYDRLKQLYKSYANQDKPLMQIVKNLITQPDMNQLYLNEEKNLKQMMEFINNKAKEFAVNNVSIIEDEKVYSWAIEYFNKSNEELGFNEKKIETPETKIMSKPKNNDNEQLNLGV